MSDRFIILLNAPGNLDFNRAEMAGYSPIHFNPFWPYSYDHPLVAVLMDMIHGGFTIHDGLHPKMFRCRVTGPEVAHLGGLYYEPTTLRMIEEMELPSITEEQRVRTAILFARPSECQSWNQWADCWLSGQDRSAQRADCMNSPHLTPAMGEYLRQIGVVGPKRSASLARLAAGKLARHDPRMVQEWVGTSIRCRFEEVKVTTSDLVAICEQAIREESPSRILLCRSRRDHSRDCEGYSA